jgi:Ca2+-binding EF-hand superfamily protein
MLLAFGAASATLDAIKSLTTKPSSSQPIGSGPASGSSFDISAPPSGGSTAVPGFNGGAQISPATLSALLAAQSQSSTGAAAPAATDRAGALQDLFSQIDGNGDGQITKSEFEKALGAGGTNIAQADHVFSQLDKNGDGTVSIGELASALQGRSGGHHHHVHGGGLSGSGADQSLPAPTTSSGAASSSYNLIEQLLQRQANAISSSNTPLSVNV